MTTQNINSDQGSSFLTEAGFMKAVDPILPLLRARARRMTGNVNDGDDLVQDTLVRAWRYRDRFEPGSNLKAWMIQIERNSFLSDLRRVRPTVELPPDYAHTGLRVNAGQETNLHMEDLDRAVRTLPREQHDAFVVAQGGKRYREASQQLGISERALKSRVARARSAIVRSLDAAPPFPLKDVGTAEPARPTLTRYEEWKRAGSRTIG